MAYPLATTQRTAAGVKVSLPVEVVTTATRAAWTGYVAGFAAIPRSGAVRVWQMPLPPSAGQIWPRSGRL